MFIGHEHEINNITRNDIKIMRHKQYVNATNQIMHNINKPFTSQTKLKEQALHITSKMYHVHYEEQDLERSIFMVEAD